MATLDAFGFSRGCKSKRSTKPDSEQQLAFISPSTVIEQNNILEKQIIKPLKCNTKKLSPSRTKDNKITRYFASTPIATVAMEIDENEEEADIICIVRNKKPFSNFWNNLQNEFDLDDDEEDERLLMLDKANNNTLTKKRRHIEESQVTTQRQKKMKNKEPHLTTTIDIDFSQFMVKSLNLNGKHCQSLTTTNNNSNIYLNTLFQQYQQKESLTRVLRYKMSLEESKLLLKRIEQNFLYS
ncbi:uncharacterized protein BX663DRAFT_524663 [Cokeromyces recurvatus]|uniref:uncharacterized protein n=1 Tax=Cokeromyces recurvatus TaxID=90255 RepID=UPI00221F1538|nr:uncharacterized protein BX663DRAFT_524663 [Cokeromyces recurvatus]KAI7898581.1 hypothetical protein BX663DRAFT_524663 [Cokeromyces recurvatus]